MLSVKRKAGAEEDGERTPSKKDGKRDKKERGGKGGKTPKSSGKKSKR